MLHLVTVIADLGQRQVGFRSLCDGALDTTTATGELVFHIFSALAQFERRLIQERTRADSLPPAPGASMEDGKLRADPSSPHGVHAIERPNSHSARDLSALAHCTRDLLPLCGLGTTSCRGGRTPSVTEARGAAGRFLKGLTPSAQNFSITTGKRHRSHRSLSERRADPTDA